MESVIFPSYFLSMILAGEITNFCKNFNQFETEKS